MHKSLELRRRRSAFVVATACGASVLIGVAKGQNQPVALSPISFNANTIVNNANGTITGGNPADIDPQNNQTFYSSAYSSVGAFPVNTTFASSYDEGAVFQTQPAGQNNTLLINDPADPTDPYGPVNNAGTVYLSTPEAYTGTIAFLVSGTYYGSASDGDIPMYATLNFTDGSSITNALYPQEYHDTYEYAQYPVPVGVVNTATGNLVGNSSSGTTYTASLYNTALSNNYYDPNDVNQKLASITFTPIGFANDFNNDDYPDARVFALYGLSSVTTTPTLTYTGVSSSNWNSATGVFTTSTFNNSGQYNVLFDDSATGSTNIMIPSAVTPGSVSFNNSSKAYVISGAAIGDSSSGPTGIGVNGGGTVTFNNVNTYTGPTNVNAGELIISPTGAIASNSLLVASGATLLVQAGGSLTNTSTSVLLGGTLTLANHSSAPELVLQASSLTLSGTSGSWTGKLDLGNNEMIVHNGSIGVITNQLAQGYAGGKWNSTGGIVSSAAAGNTTHLTALGVIINDTTANTTGSLSGTAIYNSSHGASTSDGDILVKYTYYGDANLDGKVDGSDYSLIDSAYLNNQKSANTPLTGWYNGDFNYDGVIDGSDYTLMDNAFNQQGASLLSTLAATPTAQIAAPIGISAVPEPTAGLLGIVSLGLFGRRRQRSD